MIMPYLQFPNGCEEAFALYRQAFGGELNHLSRYGDMPGSSQGPGGQRVLHAMQRLTGEGAISGGDAQPGGAAAVYIQAHLDSEAQARSAFDTLAQSGTVLSPLAPNPPPDESGVSGAVCDRFGFTWVISALRD